MEVVKTTPINRKIIALLQYKQINNYYQIDRFCVHEDYRQKGYGKLLIEHLVNLAIENMDVQFIQVYPKSEDELSEALIEQPLLYSIYQKYGFVSEDEDFDANQYNHLLKYRIK